MQFGCLCGLKISTCAQKLEWIIHILKWSGWTHIFAVALKWQMLWQYKWKFLFWWEKKLQKIGGKLTLPTVIIIYVGPFISEHQKIHFFFFSYLPSKSYRFLVSFIFYSLRIMSSYMYKNPIQIHQRSLTHVIPNENIFVFFLFMTYGYCEKYTYRFEWIDRNMDKYI